MITLLELKTCALTIHKLCCYITQFLIWGIKTIVMFGILMFLCMFIYYTIKA